MESSFGSVIPFLQTNFFMKPESKICLASLIIDLMKLKKGDFHRKDIERKNIGRLNRIKAKDLVF